MAINLNSSTSAVVSVPPSFGDVVTLRIKKYSYNKEKNRIEWDAEIAAPEKATVDGVEYILAGQELKFYNSLSDEVNGNAKMSGLAQLKDFHTKLGLPMELDEDSLPYEGLLFEFYLTSSEKKLQRKTENGKYEALLDENGKPRTLGWQFNNYLSNVVGPSSFGQ
jgi:hypothetical protein